MHYSHVTPANRRLRFPWAVGIALLAGLALTAGQSRPVEARRSSDLTRFRFFTGSARGDDLNAFVWVGMGGGKTYGTFFDVFDEVAFRLEGPAIQNRSGNGTLRLTARFPVDQRRIGTFTGPLRRGALRGKWSAIGRNGTWRLGEATRDREAMALLAGTYIEQETERPNRKLRVTLDAETGAATFTLLRRGETFTLSGVWMADTEENLWLLGLKGDGTLGDLTPLDLNVRRWPVVFPYLRRQNGVIRILNPLATDQTVTALRPEVQPPD